MRQILPALVAFWCLASLVHPRPLGTQEPAPESGFKTAHVFDLESEEDLTEVLQIMRRFNALFDELGYPESRYHLWKLDEEGSLPRYLWESTWPSRAIYDEVHALESFEALLTEVFPKTAVLLNNNHQYGQYSEIPIG